MSELKNKQLAEAIVQFLETELGKKYLEALSLYYNGLHQDAERDNISMEQKAMFVERAAGVHWAIDWMLRKKQLLEQGYYKEEKAEG